MKLTFMGAGSTVFAKNVLGDVMLTDNMHDFEIALYDIDAQRLEESFILIDAINRKLNEGRATVEKYLGVAQRKDALRNADFIVNAIQVGLYDPCTIIDFEIPKKYGLRQTIGDTLGIGGIMRGLRTIQVLKGFARDMEEVCPNALFLNYTNPMAIVTGFMQRYSKIRTVGLCHSVQACTYCLLTELGMEDKLDGRIETIAGINHMGWLLDIRDKFGNDLYPEIRRRALEKNRTEKHNDMVRFEIMKHFGYYNTESSEHTAEYHPYFIKKLYPELIEEFNIPLDEYLRRCQNQIAGWHRQRDEIVHNKQLTHTRTLEYGSYIMEAMITDKPIEIGGNVLNNGLISNLPAEACVEVPCLVNRNGVQGCAVGELPPQCAALNMTHINVHNLVIEAAMAKSRSLVYQAAMLDPHTRSELTLDEIKAMCDDLFEAHIRDGVMLEYK